MDVIPLIISEEAVGALTDELLAKLASCSTQVVNNKIIEYLENPGADPVIKQRVAIAYSFYIETTKYLESEQTAKDVELIKDLSYDSISPQLSMDELQEYRRAISDMLSNDKAIPYIAPIKGTLIQELREEMAEYGKEIGNPDVIIAAKTLKKFSTLFRDSQYASYKGTPVKKIIRNRNKYEILLAGIEFMIRKKQEGAVTASWRYL